MTCLSSIVNGAQRMLREDQAGCAIAVGYRAVADEGPMKKFIDSRSWLGKNKFSRSIGSTVFLPDQRKELHGRRNQRL